MKKTWRAIFGKKPSGNWRDEFKERINMSTKPVDFIEEYNKQLGHPNPTKKDDWKLQYMIQICQEKAIGSL